MRVDNRTIVGTIYIVLGILCLVLRNDIIFYAALCAGVALSVFGILELTKERVPVGVLSLVSGIVLIILGQVMISIIIYIIAIALIVFGIVRIIEVSRYYEAVNDSFWRSGLIRPIAMILVGGLLFINQAMAVSIIFIFIGILFIVAGIFTLTEIDRRG